MISVRIEMNRRAVGEWLRAQKSNPRMNELLRAEGVKLARRAGPGFTVRTMERRRNRPGVIVYPRDERAMRLQAQENRLGKALGGGA